MGIEMRAGVLSWTGDDITPERMEEWKKLTMGEVVAKRKLAEESIAVILGHLYLQTGLNFKVIETTPQKVDEINAHTRWTYRAHYEVRLGAMM